jgi:hypothetical protein
MKTPIKILTIISVLVFFAFTTKTSISEKKTVMTSNWKPDNVGIKVALLLDTSNSMDGLIDQAKAQLWDIVNELSYAKYGGKNPNLSIALYEYGNDGLEVSDGYIRQVLDFSNDLDLISEKLFSLTTNGGSEYCGQVIQKSLNELRWGKNKQDLNLIFIAGNEAFTQGRIYYKDATANAKEKNVTVNTIFCGDYRSGVSGKWRDAALQTGGEYFAIDHNKEQIYVVTPYDALIIQLNQELNDTYIYYGSQGYSKMKLQATQDSNAAVLNEVVVVKRAVSKSSRIYNNATWDLVDASREKTFKYEDIDKKALPKTLRNKSLKELEIYVATQAKKRQEIQQKINGLDKKRRVYIAKKQSETKKDNLENAMISTIKKQAQAKNYSW